jgi:protein phosphatase
LGEDQAVTSFTIRAAGQTRQGSRSSNEDRYAIDAECHVFVVADGMGGGGNGERAADRAVEVLPHRIRAALDDHGQPETAIQQALAEAHQAILDLSEQPGHRCAAAVVLAFRRGGQVFVAWLGDCRAYHLSGDGAQRLTDDHNVRTALIRAGRLMEEEAARTPIRSVLYRYLGCAELTEPFEFRTFRPRPGDRLVLATDGLWRFAEDDLVTACRTYPDPRECAGYLAERALRRGSRDNVTCIVVSFEPVCVDAAWLAWNGGTAVRLAEAIYDNRTFEGLPILADAL